MKKLLLLAAMACSVITVMQRVSFVMKDGVAYKSS
jgi:hypothetical protein